MGRILFLKTRSKRSHTAKFTEGLGGSLALAHRDRTVLAIHCGTVRTNNVTLYGKTRARISRVLGRQSSSSHSWGRIRWPVWGVGAIWTRVPHVFMSDRPLKSAGLFNSACGDASQSPRRMQTHARKSISGALQPMIPCILGPDARYRPVPAKH